ncbi:uncharacterized protein LOC116190022 isoform X1 [Punica granatum]|uniref:Uncharacterized protein LOC116190022 isoform X1 n=1 Tax=Punica granatum TaxID=22663 RepID=A0A6P8BYU0_PUNGR|nr:uncharacterized protein LOC116190022 isoform X1 [Punica granatum]
MSSRLCILTQFKGCLGREPFCSFLGFSWVYIRVIVRFMMEKLKEKCGALFSSRGCLGCCSEYPLILGEDRPLKEVRKNQSETVKKPGIADDFWSTSAHEMDLSHRSLSSGNTSSQTLDSQHNAGSTSNSPEFVNPGLILWNQMREQWTANKSTQNEKQVREPRISWNATYEGLLGTNKPFPQPIPLSEMVDFLVDVWKQEGFYD